MEKTPLQKQIEDVITNGIGYRDSHGYALRRLDDTLRYGIVIGDTDISLRIHLGKLDAIVAKTELERKPISEEVFLIDDLASQLTDYRLKEYIKIPEYNGFFIGGNF